MRYFCKATVKKSFVLLKVL